MAADAGISVSGRRQEIGAISLIWVDFMIDLG
jgi:hypothetical protein